MTFLRIVISLYPVVWSMIFPENRYPLFGIMLEGLIRCTDAASTDHVEQVLHHLVAGGDDAGVGRIGLLGDDQLAELVGDVGVRPFERAADDLARCAQDRGAGLVGGREGTAVEALEHIRAVETGERDLGEIDGAPVGIAADEAAL